MRACKRGDMDLRLDHLVLTVTNIDRTVQFYTSVLGMKEIEYGNNRKALQFGQQKINLHQLNKEFHPHAGSPTAGSADLCFITEEPLDNFIIGLQHHEIPIVQGPVVRTGANSEILSVYFRDPDNNLIEVSNIIKGDMK